MALNIIAYTSTIENDQVVISNSLGDVIHSNNAQELLDFVAKHYAYELKAAFNLDEFIAPIIKLLPLSKLKELASQKHEVDNLFYIPHTIFGIVNNDSKTFVYHLAQYYPDMPEPNNVNGVKKLTEDIFINLHKMNQYPHKLTSPISIYESSIMNHFSLPTILDVPDDMDDVISYAEETIGRNWVEAFQVGHWNANEIFSYDLQSAFGSTASKLYDFRYAKFIQSNKLIDADWGFLKGRITIHDDVKVSPIMYRTHEDMTINPTGSWDTIITLDELNFINKWHIGDFKLENGYFIKFWSKIQPLLVPLNKLFTQRQISPTAKMIAKQQAAAVWGKMIEQHDDGKVGRYYNPIWASYISTRVRLQVAQFIYEHNLQDDLIHVGTDGIMTSGKVSVPVKLSMGEWKENESMPTFIVSSGRVYTNDKKPHGLTYDIIKELINQKPNSTYYQTLIKRRQTLNDSVALNDLSNIGKLKDFPSSLDLIALRLETDRVFPDFPKTGKDLIKNKYSSNPINVVE